MSFSTSAAPAAAWPKAGQKRLHWRLNSAALALVATALAAAFTAHLLRGIPSLYSAHSWVGLLAVALFTANLGLGGWAYLLQQPPPKLRGGLRPLQVRERSRLPGWGGNGG